MNARRSPLFIQAQAGPGRPRHRGCSPLARLFPLLFASALLLLGAGAQAAAANVLMIDGDGDGTVSWKAGAEEGVCTITVGTPSGECEVNPEEFVPVTTTAVAAGGFEFVKWTYVGGGTTNCTNESGTKNPCNTTFFGTDEEGTLTATFEAPEPNIVKVKGSGTGSGTVVWATSNWWITELDCHITAGVADEVGGGCEAEVEQGELLKPDKVEFIPDPGSSFVKCSYAGQGLSECVPLPEENPSVLVFSGTGEEGVLTVELEGVPPEITKLIPAWGPIGGGNTVMIEGQGLVAVSEVSFGSTAAPGWVEVSPTELEVTAPSGAPLDPLEEDASVTLTLTTAGGEADAGYIYLGAPMALTIAKTGSGDGDFECSPGEPFEPGGTFGPCLSSYLGGQSVLVRATPDSGSTFGGWSGCDAILSLTGCRIDKIASPTTITASFHEKPESLPDLPAADQPFEILPIAPEPEGGGNERKKLRKAIAQRKACIAKARKAHRRARRAAKGRSGKARARTLRKANRRKARTTKGCNRRFKRQRKALRQKSRATGRSAQGRNR